MEFPGSMNDSCSGLRGRRRSGVPRRPGIGSPMGETRFCSSPRSRSKPLGSLVSGDREISLLGTTLREQPASQTSKKASPKWPEVRNINQEPPSTTKWAFLSNAEVVESALGVANSSPMESTSTRLVSAPRSARYCFTLDARRSPRDLL